jgi:TonB family protein
MGIQVMLIATAIAVPFLIDGPKRKNEIVVLPVVKYAESDYDLEKDTSMVLTLGSDNKLYQRQIGSDDKAGRTDTIITAEGLHGAIESSMEGKTPDKRVVYIKGDINAAYENVLQVFDSIRKADVDKVGLVVVGERNEDDPFQTAPLSFEVRLPEIIDRTNPSKPNPLTLVAMLEKDSQLKLNNESAGTLSDAKVLRDKLTSIFKDRENNGVFREGTNEVEKTVFLQVSNSVRYGDFIKLVEAVKGSGAQPIGIQIDDVAPPIKLKTAYDLPLPLAKPTSIPKTISGGVLNGKATSLPKPNYPPAAKAVRASGSVSVQVMVDTSGNVTSAMAVSGHPLLRSAAVAAARSAKFSPTLLSGQPVNVTGVLTYNFVP